MLTNISGISEEKAIAIMKKYPSLKSLMQGYESLGSVEQKELMLVDLSVIYNFDENKAKRLGKAISTKIYRVFNDIDANEYV